MYRVVVSGQETYTSADFAPAQTEAIKSFGQGKPTHLYYLTKLCRRWNTRSAVRTAPTPPKAKAVVVESPHA
jgi:hypothetical protein